MMNSKQLETSKQTFLDKLNEHLKKIEGKTQIKRKNFYTIILTSLILIWTGICDIYISYLITMLYPALWTLKEIKKKEMDGAKQWVTYWVIFSLFVSIDMFLDQVMAIVPFYVFIRTIFLLWLHLPNFKGAVIVYNTFILEILKYTNNFAFLGRNQKNKLLIEVEDIIQKKSRDSPLGSFSATMRSSNNYLNSSSNCSITNTNSSINNNTLDKDKKNN